MNLIYTEHALQRLAKRQLEPAWVERAVASPARIEPDETDPTLEHRLAVVPELCQPGAAGYPCPKLNPGASSPRIWTAK